MSEDLVASGLDYAPFVQLPEAGLTVQPGGWRQLCVDGVQHGKRYQLTLREGRNRQVRRMCAAVGLPCLRLIRWRVGDWTLEGLAPGEMRRV